jgi:hypothetical protein
LREQATEQHEYGRRGERHHDEARLDRPRPACIPSAINAGSSGKKALDGVAGTG